MSTPVYLCGACGRFMVCQRNSVTVEEYTDEGAPYRLWDADRWACPECAVEIVAGFGKRPIAEHWQPEYAAVRARLMSVTAGRWRYHNAD